MVEPLTAHVQVEPEEAGLARMERPAVRVQLGRVVGGDGAHLDAAHELLLDHVARAQRQHPPGHPLGDRVRADEPGPLVRQPLHVARREMIVVRVRDEDQVRRRPLSDAVRIDVHRRAPDAEPEAGVAEPGEGVEEH
jgi:hypothetical protein